MLISFKVIIFIYQQQRKLSHFYGQYIKIKPFILYLRLIPKSKETICINLQQFFHYQIKENISKHYPLNQLNVFLSQRISQSFTKFIDFLQNSIPKPNSVLNGVNSSLDDILELRVIFVSQMGDEMGSLGAMEASIKLNMSVEIPFQCWTINLVIIKGLDDLAKHLGNGILSSEEKLARSVGDGSEDSLTRIFVEFLDIGWVVGSIDSLFNVLKSVLIISHFGDRVDVVFNWLGISTDFIHSLDIELEMGKILSINMGFISLLTNDDFIDKSSSIDVGTWSPESSGIGDIPLEILNEQEEIPNSKAMSFHKESCGFNGVDCSIEGMSVKSGLMVLEVGVIKRVSFFHFQIIRYIFVI